MRALRALRPLLLALALLLGPAASAQEGELQLPVLLEQPDEASDRTQDWDRHGTARAPCRRGCTGRPGRRARSR